MTGERDEPPPFLGTWKRIYMVVLLYLALFILGLSFFTLAWR
jgi:hypothetical protein